MRKGVLVLAVLGWLLAGDAGQAFDTVKMTKGGYAGRVVGMTALQVDLEQAGPAALKKEIPVNQIVIVYYDDDPRELKAAKDLALEGQYAEALASLERIKREPGRAEVVQDIEFYKAFCAAKLALAGNGKIVDAAGKPGAGRLMKNFVDSHPNSYHFFEASELLGELLLAVKQYDQAREHFQRLAKAPWPDYQLRAETAEGRSLLAEGKAAEAVTVFDKVIASPVSSELADAQRLSAMLGKARALIALNQPDRAIALAGDVLKKTSDDAVSLRAQAYNVQGTAYRRTDRPKEALFAFLHVDFFYSSAPAAHAEALANLVELWEQFFKNERANEARETLETQYPDSVWNRK